MKTTFLSLFALLSLQFAQAQTELIIDFEDIGLEADSFLNGSDGAILFGFPQETFGNYPFEFPVNFQTFDSGGFWVGGWAISTVLDTMTGDFTNLYGAAAGRGNDNSLTYAIGQNNAHIKLATMDQLVNGAPFTGFYVTNTTYAARVIRDGNDFTDGPFGGEDGTRPDFFRLQVKAFAQGSATGDSTEIYLADYRFEDDSQDYIIEDWTYVELPDWVPFADSISFTLLTSDVGVNGPNTPYFFAVDDLSFNILTSTLELPPSLQPTAYPNPVSSELLRLQWPADAQWTTDLRWYLHDALGRPVAGGSSQPYQIDISQQPAGVYYLVISSVQGRTAVRVLKE
ncbi:MAG: DUF4465 domain-containing protein [Bacteroidota bacterium]